VVCKPIPPGEFPHGQRFHGEAKFFFHCAVVTAFLLIAVVVAWLWLKLDRSDGDYAHSLFLQWWFPFIIGIGATFALFWLTRRRATRKALQIFQFLDQSNGKTGDVRMKNLQRRIETFQAVYNAMSGNIKPEPTEEQVKELAFWIWTKRGRRDGFDKEDWADAGHLLSIVHNAFREAKQTQNFWPWRSRTR